MSARPRTIQIYLPSGDPRGVRVAALTTSIVQVIEVPRAMLAQFQEMSQANQVGVYFLMGDQGDGEQPTVYIGQTGFLGKRLGEHHVDPKKDFWNRALVAVSLTHSVTQTHALYLEWQSILTANMAKRYDVQNGNAGSKPHTPAPLEADCQDIFDTIRMLLATLGHPVFEPLAGPGPGPVNPDEDMFFYCKGSTFDAKAQYNEDGMVVLKGSKARKDMVPSMEAMSAGKKRLSLIAEGRLLLEGDNYVFQEDIPFGSPSGASDVVTGTSSNGWLMWRSLNNKTLDELKRQPASLAPKTE